MKTNTKTRLLRALIFIVIFALTWFIALFFVDPNLQYRAGILGAVAGFMAVFLTPKIEARFLINQSTG